MASKNKKQTRNQISEGIFEAVTTKRIEQLRDDLQKAERINILVLKDLNFLISAIEAFIDAVPELNTKIFKSYYIGIDIEAQTKEEKAVTKTFLETTLTKFKVEIEKSIKTDKESWLNHIRTEILGPAHKVVLGLEDAANKTIVSALLSRLKKTDPVMYSAVTTEVSNDKTAFFVRNFNKAGDLKRDIIDYIFTQVFNGTLTEAEEKLIALVKSGVHRGHGAGAGAAVSYIAVAEGAAFLTKKELNTRDSRQKLIEGIEKDLKQKGITLTPQELLDIKKVIIKWGSLVDYKTGKVKADYIPYIELQDWTSNSAVDARREKLVAQSVRNYIASLSAYTIAEATSSPSLKDQMISVAIAPIFGIQLNSKNLKKKRTKVSKDYLISGASLRLKGQESFKNKISSKKVTYREISSKVSAGRPANISKPKSFRPTSTGFNQLQLVGILNASLPPVVRKNMQYPALQNRTGLFSESVKITSIDQTPKGFPSISYTYDKIPYQVFEMGIGKAPWATPERDPRKLIDKSVRELAAEYMTQRFYTKRV